MVVKTKGYIKDSIWKSLNVIAGLEWRETAAAADLTDGVLHV